MLSNALTPSIIYSVKILAFYYTTFSVPHTAITMWLKRMEAWQVMLLYSLQTLMGLTTL